MGGDIAPEMIALAAAKAAYFLPDCAFTLFGPSEFSSLAKEGISFEPASDIITGDDLPLECVKNKANSSLVRGVQAAAERKLDAFISCGNTGALIAASSLSFSRLPHMSRPALLTHFPSYHGRMVVLDVGGNLITKARRLVQFAYLGSSYAMARFGIERPKVALLNIGQESEKGTSELREAYRTLEQASGNFFTFIGNVEGHDAFLKGVDVLVTNGFTGNIFLKTAEGIASFVFRLTERKIAEQLPDENMLESWLELKRFLSYEASEGALCAGIDGIIIKCHGTSSQRAIFNAILGVCELSENEIIPKMAGLLREAFIPKPL
jgi:glycerol-3-phosphate acyltransferase PlsX